MSEHNNKYDDFYYDDGRFCDNNYDEKHDDYDIPTYDELELEGRYYLYGSREEYNLWRNEQILVSQGQSNAQQSKLAANSANARSSIGCVIILFITIFILVLYSIL